MWKQTVERHLADLEINDITAGCNLHVKTRLVLHVASYDVSVEHFFSIFLQVKSASYADDN